MPIFNQDVARAVTMNGRISNKFVADSMNALYASKGHKNFTIAGDTDSVVGSTIINTSIGDMKIEDFYNSELFNNSYEEKRDGNDNFVKHIADKNVKGLSLSKDNSLEMLNINYIMKHKVKKRMFKITSGKDSVIVTEDHSVIVIRDNCQISVKPSEILKSDKIIKI